MGERSKRQKTDARKPHKQKAKRAPGPAGRKATRAGPKAGRDRSTIPPPEGLENDIRLALRGLQAHRPGKPLAQATRRALRRLVGGPPPPSADQPRKLSPAERAVLYDQIPAGDWAKLAGQTPAKLRAQAKQSGIPLANKTVKLSELAPAISAYIIRREAPGTEAEERRTLARADREEMARERERLHLDREHGKVLARVEAERREVALMNWMVAVLERAAVELGPLVVGRKSIDEVNGLVADYFYARRSEAVERNKEQG